MPSPSQIASGPTVLEGTTPSVSKAASNLLLSLAVDVKLGTRVTNTTVTPSGQTSVTLSTDQTLLADLVLFSTGLTPNSAYVPSAYKNAAGFVLVDEYLHVKGIEDGSVWAVGDISAAQRPQAIHTEKQSVHVAKNVGLAIQGKPVAVFNPGTTLMVAAPIGRKSGTGHIGSWKLPGFMVHFLKGKTYFTENLPKMVAGTNV